MARMASGASRVTSREMQGSSRAALRPVEGGPGRSRKCGLWGCLTPGRRSGRSCGAAPWRCRAECYTPERGRCGSATSWRPLELRCRLLRHQVRWLLGAVLTVSAARDACLRQGQEVPGSPGAGVEEPGPHPAPSRLLHLGVPGWGRGVGGQVDGGTQDGQGGGGSASAESPPWAKAEPGQYLSF